MFLITSRETDELETEIYPIGEDEDIDAALAFSSEEIAQQYVNAAGMSETQSVAELHPIDFVGWLIELYNNDVKLLVLDADHEQFHAGEPQIAVDIQSQLAECQERIVDLARLATEQQEDD